MIIESGYVSKALMHIVDMNQTIPRPCGQVIILKIVQGSEVKGGDILVMCRHLELLHKCLGRVDPQYTITVPTT